MRGNSYEALRDWDTRARSMFDCSTGAIESIEPLRRLTFRLEAVKNSIQPGTNQGSASSALSLDVARRGGWCGVSTLRSQYGVTFDLRCARPANSTFWHIGNLSRRRLWH